MSEDPFSSSERSSQEKPEQLQHSGETKVSRISQIGAFLLKWMRSFVSEHTPAELNDTIHLTLIQSHDISDVPSRKEAIAKAEKAINELEKMKNMLTEKYGAQAASFIAKSIDPKIAHSRQLIQNTKENRDVQNSFSKIIEQAIDTVELYGDVSDETKLIKKIILEAESACRYSIFKDLELLLRYQQQHIQRLHLAEDMKNALIDEIDVHLKPIARAWQAMTAGASKVTNLQELFLWKEQIDERRAAFSEFGLLLIDSLFGVNDRKRQKDAQLEQNEERIIEEYTTFALIEERATRLLEFISKKAICDAILVEGVDTLLQKLKQEAEDCTHVSDSLVLTLQKIEEHIRNSGT